MKFLLRTSQMFSFVKNAKNILDFHYRGQHKYFSIHTQRLRLREYANFIPITLGKHVLEEC